MTKAKHTPAGYLALALHAHLPYVVNHGTWPHGLEWLLEVAAETYLPLLHVLANLERDGIPAHLNINLSPVLLEQLAHPHFIAEFPRYVERKITAAREDEAFFLQAGDQDLVETARMWGRFYTAALQDFSALGGDIVSGFRRFADSGNIEVLTCAATHGYLPLLGSDESVRAQVRLAVSTHARHFGQRPRGIWVPECGYRPAGFWEYPVARAGADDPGPGFDRIGIEHALAESGLEYFFVDSHLVDEDRRAPSPYGPPESRVPRTPRLERVTRGAERSLYQPYYVDGPYDKRHAATIFPRDPSTGLQVWSGDSGYPADPNYLDFHKKRFPGGHRYWRVTGPGVDIGDKQVYRAEDAAARVREHAEHFVSLVCESLRSAMSRAIPPVLCAPFDAELFGHWWFEGPMWLEAVCREVHACDAIATICCSDYLDSYPRAGFITMPEGSWGAEGGHQVWMNPETSWTYTHLYAAEDFLREVCTAKKWCGSGLGTKIVQQMCRELLLLESSDWQFLITTGAARDYAELRFLTHNDQFLELQLMWQAFERDGELNEHMTHRLSELEERDSIFADLDPGLWAEGACESTVTMNVAGGPGDPGDRPKSPTAEHGLEGLSWRSGSEI
ncbi:MAG TPA: 1,4-alpha-glucan branching protein domain-containing protein [Acidobacteriaceae bacterium]|nr:1,4-alpha-glucan branching protein domain-containing protein [Acidobacteriaceae bacterium]